MVQCPTCGAGVRFDIASQKMHCDYCGNSFEPSSVPDNSSRDDAKGAEVFDTFVYSCPSCGGELLTTDKTDAIGFCPYCGGASMLFDKMREQWRPDYIIPFQITKEQCKEFYVKAAKKSPFTSNQYRNPELIESFRGIYMPYWNYRALQRGPFVLRGKKTGVFRNSFFKEDGNINYTLDGYAHDASLSFDDRISENLAPFDTSQHKPFAPCYLSGFYADIGDVSARTYHKRSEDYMRKATVKAMAEDKRIAHAKGVKKIKIDKDSAQVPTQITSAARVLYPVWFMSYRKNNRLTYAAVNGQTGKVSADLPLSPLKILIAVLIFGAAIAASLFFLPSVKANWTLIVTLLLLVVGTFVLRANFRRTVNPRTGLDQTEEAKKFLKRDNLRLLGVIATVIAGAVVAYKDPAYNIVSYLSCLAVAAELFYMMYRHIRFQVAIAMRRPPQFNKKGAQSDEN